MIATLPARDTLDLSLATWDYATDTTACNGQSQSVWYTFTPAISEKIAIDPSPSHAIISIDVFTGSPDALSFLGCAQGGYGWNFNSGFILNATAGTTYWIMASPICCEPVPVLDLSFYPAVAPQATLRVDGATIDRGGNATITGTLDCAGIVPNPTRLEGDVRQNVGRLSSVHATFETGTPCATTLSWTVLAQPGTGKFVGGPATVNATATICNIVGCAFPTTTAVITLRG